MAPMRGGRSRVLLVVDEAGSSADVGSMLRGAGLAVGEVRADEAPAAIRRGHHDLVVLDLAGHQGWDVLEQVQGQPALPPILVISAHGGDARVRSHRRRVAASLFRPVSAGEVLGTCERILALTRRSEAYAGERRRHQRRRLVAQVTFGGGDAGGVPGTLLDVSPQGFQAELRGAASPGQPGDEVRVRIATGRDNPTLTGRVRWWRAMPTGVVFGAELDDQSEANAAALGQLMS